MHTSMRPLLHSGVSGSIAAHSVGRSARRLFPAPSPCTSPSTCPQSAQVLNAHVELSKAAASASNTPGPGSDASTTAVLASRALERSFNGAVTATWSDEDHLAEHFPRPHALESGEPQPVASTSAASDPIARARPKRRRGGTAAAAAGAESGPSSSASAARDQDPGATPRSRGRPSPRPHQTSSPSGPGRQTPPRPRLRPPPPPISWPDYPYTRHPVASACSPYDTAGLKLEALFQCVLHYPRAPPKLLRFLRREASDGVEGRLAAITATVECLTELVGREVAVYLIRRNSWVVLVPAEAVAPRMEAMRRLLGLQPGGLPDLLRKNPNLLRMQEGSLLGRYKALQDALYDAVGFDEHKLRALILKYPLILNFKHESVHNALTALRLLCSARPTWAAFYKALSPSQVAFFIRERVVTLLRLEYLLLTGAGSTWTLRDIMKMSNNMFKKAYGGFRSWMQERLLRLRQRMAQARRAVEAHAAEEGQPLSPESLGRVAAQVQAQYARAEQERFQREYVRRREAERQDLTRRMEQRQRTIEEKMKEQELLKLQGERKGEAGEEEEDDEEDGEQQRRRMRQQQQQQQRLGDAGAARVGGSPAAGPPRDGRGPSAEAAAAARARQGSRPAVPPAAAALSADPLDGVSLGRVWQRPGSKVAAGPPPGGSAHRYRQ